MKVLNWIKYWRDSLADAESININISAVDAKYKIDAIDITENSLPQELFNIFWPADELASLKKDQILEKEILISPLSLVPRLNHTKSKTDETEISPFWISAVVTSENGLKPGDNKFPQIPRVILEPASYKDITFSTVSKVDEIFAKAEISDESWHEFIQSTLKVFKDITEQDIFDFRPEEFFEVKYQWVIIPNELVKGASYHILQLYNQLCKKDKFPPLLETMVKEKSPKIIAQYSKEEVFDKSEAHLGQMNNGFGLSPSQRKSLSHYVDLKEGEVLAVNGPPGTGKTTLIQSVIADNFIKAALVGGAPMVTVASSTNNQAITNIIESFSKGDAKSVLEERWLAGITSFALYMVSSDEKKIEQSKKKKWLYHSSKQNASSLVEIEKEDYLAKAERDFQIKFKALTGKEITDLKAAQHYFQDQIKEHNSIIEQGIQKWKKFTAIFEILKQYKADYTEEIVSQVTNQFFENELKQTNVLVAKLLEAKQKEPFYFWLLSFLKKIREQRTVYYQSVFIESSFDTSLWDFSSSTNIQEILLAKSQLIKQAYANFKEFNSWKESVPEFKNEIFSITNDGDGFLGKLDTLIRYKSFYHAVHYWEARWIQDTRIAVVNNTNWKSTLNGTIDRLRRFSMLTPCFVSTFHMLPKMMQYTRYPSREVDYLEAFIDLLIVDESGQVSPEVGIPSFYLAKKALVVGDNYQIEPVWNVDGKSDQGNLIKNGLLKTEDKARIESLMKWGYMSSNGSLMKLAQKSCSFEFSNTERGLLLTEHRRCLDQIIGYCNELVYDNLLEPLTTLNSEPGDLLPPMAFLNIIGTSTKDGASRSNKIEAYELIKWIKRNEAKIVDFIYSKEQKESKNPDLIKRKALQDIIGIVTPFAAQKRHLTTALNLNGYPASLFQYGTVHSLQGAEKDIVFFSPVYTAEVKSGYFFDRGPNMLNVAVSRAKRSFIVAGDKRVFKKDNRKIPSSLLAYYITKDIV